MSPTLDMLGIAVHDMARALAFYRALGLPIAPGQDDEGHVEITLPNGLRLAWDTHAVIQSFRPAWQPASGGGHSIGLAFLCATPAEVDAQFARLTALGAPAVTPPFDAFWGQRYAQVADPDGNAIDLFAPLPAGD